MKLFSKCYLDNNLKKKIHLGESFFLVNITFLVLFIVLIIYLRLYANSSENGIQCQYKIITGKECETCGYTRAFVLYLNGEFTKGIKLNQSSILYFLAFCYLFITRLFWVIFSLFIQKNKLSKKIIFIDILISILIITIATINIYLV
jgi:hypothetical protein